MAHRFADKSQRIADDMDARIFGYAEEAHRLGWEDVARALDSTRGALRNYLHPEDRKAADNA